MPTPVLVLRHVDGYRVGIPSGLDTQSSIEFLFT